MIYSRRTLLHFQPKREQTHFCKELICIQFYSHHQIGKRLQFVGCFGENMPDDGTQTKSPAPKNTHNCQNGSIFFLFAELYGPLNAEKLEMHDVNVRVEMPQNNTPTPSFNSCCSGASSDSLGHTLSWITEKSPEWAVLTFHVCVCENLCVWSEWGYEETKTKLNVPLNYVPSENLWLK